MQHTEPSGAPRVSVIVPVYQTNHTLARCVMSILSQTERSIEIILVNDGAAPADARYCREIAQTDARVRLIEQDNRGLSAARNSGLAVARGDYISFVDADDAIEPEMLQMLLALLADSGKQMAVCGVTVSGIGGIIGTVTDGVLTAAEMLRRTATADGWCYVIACNKLYHRTLFDGERFPVGKIHEDEFLIPRLIVRAGGAACTARCGYVYYLHPDSTSQQLSPSRLDYVEALITQLELAKQENYTDICEGIINRELYAYLVLRASALMRDAETKSRLCDLHRRFAAVADGCRVSWFLRCKRSICTVAPRLYYRLDTLLLRFTNG